MGQESGGRASGGEKLPLGDEGALGQTARQAVRDAKRAMARALRRHLGELEVGLRFVVICCSAAKAGCVMGNVAPQMSAHAQCFAAVS